MAAVDGYGGPPALRLPGRAKVTLALPPLWFREWPWSTLRILCTSLYPMRFTTPYDAQKRAVLMTRGCVSREPTAPDGSTMDHDWLMGGWPCSSLHPKHFDYCIGAASFVSAPRIRYSPHANSVNHRI